MNLAINALPLMSPLTGIGKYTYYLAQEFSKLSGELDVEYFYAYNYSRELLQPGNEGGRKADVIRRFPAVKPYVKVARNYLAAMTRRRFDVYFEPNFIPIAIPARRKVVTVADFSFMTHPECHPKERLDYFSSKFWPRIKTADHIIFISEFIRQYGIENYGFSEEHSTSIPLGVQHSQFRVMSNEELCGVRKRLGLPEKFILFVGSLEPRKNLERTLRAYLSLPQNMRDEYKCVLAGGSGWNNSGIQQLINEHPGQILRLGYVADEDLPSLYNLASLFLFASLYEGFGLPALEAMSCGCPVLSSNVTSLPAVCGDAALLVDPNDIEAIRDGMARILDDESLAAQLRERGLEHAQGFTWEQCARKHLDIFNQVL